MVYCHGGLNDEKAAASRIASMLPYLLANEIYPLHFMWETGFLDSVLGIVADAFRRGRSQGWTDDMNERFTDILDVCNELAAKTPDRPEGNPTTENHRRR